MASVTYKRPADLFGGTQKLKLGDDPAYTVYITVNFDDLGPVEVFCRVGKGENDTLAHASAICRLVCQALQAAPDRDKAVNALAMTLRGTEGKSQGFNRGVLIKSIPDAIGWALLGYPDSEGNKVEYTKGIK